MIDLILFDCDGVLVDSEILANRIIAELKTELGHPITVEEQIRRFVGLSVHSEAVIEELKKFPPGFRELVRERTRLAYERELRAIAGVHEVLAALTQRICVVSNSLPDSLDSKLRRLDLLKFFGDRVFGVAPPLRPKPAPDLMAHAAWILRADPAHCLVIEDSVTGVTAARNAGMKVYGFLGGGHVLPETGSRLMDAGASRVFNAMSELPLLLESD